MARPIRLALAVALVLLAAAGAGYSLTHRTGRTATKTAAPASSMHQAGTITILWPGGWPTPGWPINLGPFAGNLWDALVDYRPDGTFFTELAAQVPSSANGGLRVVNNQTVITYHLKPRLRWSDGSPITPADYIAAPLVGSAPEIQTFGQSGTTFCPFHAVTISGSTLVMTLDGIYSGALEMCYFTPAPWEYYQRKYHITVPAGLTASFDVTRAAAMYAAPSYKGSALQRLILKLRNDPYTAPGDIFSGPYRMTSWSKIGAGVEAPNPYFTALPPDPHHPRPARIRLVTLSGDYMADSRAIIQGAIPANVDVAFVGREMPSYRTPPLPFQAHPPLKLMLAPLFPEVVELNVEQPALRDKRVRQALLYAIDKIAYLRQLSPMSAAQAAAIADTSPFGHLMRFSIADQFPANLYNPTKARALLAAAGYATSATGPGRRLRLDLYATTNPLRERGDEILQRLWRRVGIDVRLHFVNQRGAGGIFSSYANGGILARGAFDIFEESWSPNRDDGLDYLGSLDPGQIPDQNHPDVGGNDGRVRDRALFSLLEQAQRTFDDATRQQLYAQFQHAMVDQAYWIPLYDFTEPVWVRPTIGNFNPYGGPFGTFYFTGFFWNSYEWYVK